MGGYHPGSEIAAFALSCPLQLGTFLKCLTYFEKTVKNTDRNKESKGRAETWAAWIKKDIDPVMTNHAGEVLLKQILSKGRRILVRDSYFDAYFTMIAVSRIVDFNSHLKQMQDGMKQKILES